jgi:indolepyruvate ferredoxin oxidoreductase alpha subunit
MGNQALAFGALKAGVAVVSGYPGTPSSEILETIAEQVGLHHLVELHVEWSTNEKAALEVGVGAAFAGARALVTMKQVGLNVASDALMSLPYLGVKGGLVLIVADDPGPISSQTEQDTRQFAAFAKVPVFDPATPEEAFAMVQDAFDLSERYATPVIVRPVTRVCHGTVPLDTDFVPTPRKASGFERGARWVVFPQRAFEGHREILERLPLIASEFSTSTFNTVSDTNPNAPAHLGIAAGGISYAYLHDALAALERRDADGFANGGDSRGAGGGLHGLGPLRLLKIGTPFPFPEARALEFLEGLSEVLVFEELEPVIERELLQLVGAHRLPTRILGKLTGHTVAAGENSVARIAEQLGAFCAVPASPQPIDVTPTNALAGAATGAGATTGAGAAGASAGAAAGAAATGAGGGDATTGASATPAPPELPPRPPVLCAGCPHRASFTAVKRALRGRKAVFGGDIGCYTLGNALPLDMVDTCLCMGAGFTIPQGMDRVEPDVCHLGFVGDSTFFASSLTGVVNAVYNRSRVTLCVLDNATTAMTGSQPHPGTGTRVCTGEALQSPTQGATAGREAQAQGTTGTRDTAPALSIPTILRALGVEQVAQVDPFELEKATEAVRTAVDFDGPSAIVFRAPCITVAPPKPQPTVAVDTCTNCMSCIRVLGCPALIVRAQQVTIDETLCYGCGLCVNICPFDAIAAPASADSAASANSASAADSAAPADSADDGRRDG